MNSHKFRFALIFLFFGSCFSFYAQVYSAQQLMKNDHWVYDAISALSLQSGRVPVVDLGPLSVAELRLQFKRIDAALLSDSGKQLYEKVESFLYSDAVGLRFGGAFAGFNVSAEPEFLFKSNKDMDWSFATDWTNNESGDSSEKSYGNASAFVASPLNKPSVSLPIYLGWGDYFMIETVPVLAKSYWGMSDDKNFTNLIYRAGDFDFLWPQTAYGSAGYAFEKWGFNVNVGRQGLKVGRTLTGSIIYNDSFETDGYVQFNVYSEHLKYNLDIVQVESDKFMYLHVLDVNLFKWLKITGLEGSLVRAPFEIRFLNPLMIMHSFGGWDEYKSEIESDVYGEANFCAYMGFNIDVVPCKNWRIYFLYAQTEIQSKAELSGSGKYTPNGLGAQLGTEIVIPHKKTGFFKVGLEAIYTSPYLYLKDTPDASLIKERYNMQSFTNTPIYSWIGSPFGPDCIGGKALVKYENLQKWGAEASYLFLAHGTNSLGLFNQYGSIDGYDQKFYYYYPRAYRGFRNKNNGKVPDHREIPLSDDEVESWARDMGLTGIVSFNNQITLSGYYALNKHFRFEASLSYIFCFNYKNTADRFEQGVELATSVKCTLF